MTWVVTIGMWWVMASMIHHIGSAWGQRGYGRKRTWPGAFWQALLAFGFFIYGFRVIAAFLRGEPREEQTPSVSRASAGPRPAEASVVASAHDVPEGWFPDPVGGQDCYRAGAGAASSSP